MSKLPPGRYKAKLLYHTILEKPNGNTEIRIAFLPYQDALLPLPDKYRPVPLTSFLTITDATMGTADAPGWVAQTLKHIGFTSTDFAELDPASECPHSFAGRDVVILATESEYRGKTRLKYEIVRTTDQARPIDAEKLRSLSARYSGVLQALLPPPNPDDDPTEFDPVKLEQQAKSIEMGPYDRRERR